MTLKSTHKISLLEILGLEIVANFISMYLYIPGVIILWYLNFEKSACIYINFLYLYLIVFETGYFQCGFEGTPLLCVPFTLSVERSAVR